MWIRKLPKTLNLGGRGWIYPYIYTQIQGTSKL